MVRIVIVAPTLAVRAGLRALLASEGKMEVIDEASRLSDLTTVPSNTDVFVLAAAGFEAAELRRTFSSAEAAGVLLLIEEGMAGVQSLAQLPARAWGILPLDSST